MKTRRLHRILGITMLLPFAAWSATAVFFLVRPGYEAAYETLSVRRYPLTGFPRVAAGDWEEVRYLRSILGDHLLVKQKNGPWKHLDPDTGRQALYPSPEKLRALLQDAFRHNPERYGRVRSIDGRGITTTTGVDVQLDWDTLSLSQQGRDTRWIDRLYSIHYLEWSGIPAVDRILGLAGLGILMYLTYTGARIAFAPPGGLRQSREGA